MTTPPDRGHAGTPPRLTPLEIASGMVLAVATALARRHGLPLPVSVTHRFASADTHESSWQEQVIAHLELPDADAAINWILISNCSS